MFKIALNILIATTLVCYPLAVYFGLSQGMGDKVALFLGLVMVVRIVMMVGNKKVSPWLLPTAVAGLAIAACALWFEHAAWLLIYPVAINAILALFFGYSLMCEQSMIERFARIKHPDLSAKGVAYTARVTQIWVAFFIANGTAAAVLTYGVHAQWANAMQWWTLYNGLISYVLIALLGASELTYRIWLQRRGQLD